MRIKNKKSFFMVLGTIVRIILMLLVIFLIIIPACDKVRKVITDKDYFGSFNGFVEWVNVELGVGESNHYDLIIEPERAMVGFSKGTDKFECINCWDRDKTLVYDKPDVEECQDSACLCLCKDEFEFEEIKFKDQKARSGSCDYMCKALNEDIVAQTVTANTRTGTTVIWSNGFLFGSLLDLSNGLGEGLSFTKRVYVDKNQDNIAVCNDQMLKHRVASGSDTCRGTAPPIPAGVIEAGEEAIREYVLSSTFEGFVNIIDGIETHDVDPTTICHKKLDLNGFEVDEFITFDKVGDKGIVSLKKLEGGTLVDISQPREIERVIPYVIIGNEHGVISQVLADDFHLSVLESFREYLLRPNAIGLFFSDHYDVINFEGSANQKAILIQKNGNWILTSSEDVSSTFYGPSVLDTELGGLCWV